MGISGIGPGSLLLIFGIVLLVFGTKRLGNLGGDLGSAIKGFKKAVTDDESAEALSQQKEADLDESGVQEATAETVKPKD